MNSRKLIIVGLMLAGLCLIRVLSVSAATGDSDDVEERYSATEGGDDSSASRSSSDEEQTQDEIRISRPDDAASRVADDESGYTLVPGAAQYAGARSGGSAVTDDNTDGLLVPRKIGRKIASASSESVDAAPPSPIAVRPEAADAPAPTRGELKNSVIEPKPFIANDSSAGAGEYSHDSIVASSRPAGRSVFGLHGESGPETRIDPPMPSSASIARAGVQEISLIVSDYGYFPKKIFVTQNIPVKIYLTTPSKVTLCFMQDNWGLRKGISPGKIEDLEFMPDAPGDYRFYCPVKSIEGTITVREAPVAIQSMRGLASQSKAEEEKPISLDSNTPRRAAKLRQLIED